MKMFYVKPNVTITKFESNSNVSINLLSAGQTGTAYKGMTQVEIKNLKS